ncbi:MAG: ATP-binding protein [Acidobacteriaceae bacterium]
MAEKQARILVVDDREQNRYVLCRVLTQANYECLEASTGAAALALAATLPEIIILDVSLPDMSGFEVCRRIKSDPLLSQISILQISASMVSSEHKTRALEAGADGYLIHPIDGTVLVATVRSLLRLRAAEMVVRQSAEQWQATFDALSEGLAVVSADHRLIRWNAAFASMCGSDSPLQTGDDAAVLIERLLGTSEPLFQSGQEPATMERLVADRDIHLSVNRINRTSSESEIVLVLSDITDRRLAEYALRTAEKIAATAKLANAIAHEINNPLESLTNLLYLAQGSGSLDVVQGYLAQANEELYRISRITRQTLSFQRDTHLPLAMDIGSLVSDVVELFEKSAASRQVRVVCDRRPTLAIHGFPGQLRQVFGNLVRNAMEAARPGSDVTVRVRPIRRAGRAGTRVTIHDCGSGIEKSVQKRMFDPFFTTKELRGSGLGLWVSRSLVMKHQGTIRFRSSTRPGASGTTFEVYLPVGGVSPHSGDNDAK